MKKTLLLATLLAAGFGANAQLADGSIAPDFTATEMNGADGVNQEYSLYEDFLDNGKSVLIDFSATWCGPCWGFHQSHAMADLYDAYGKNGSDEIGVIFIEGDISDTVIENLYGENVPGYAPTQGDWVTGVPYPIIEDTEEMDLGSNSKFKVGFFPTIYTICEGSKETTLVPDPSNTVDTRSASYIKGQIEECQTLVGLANHGKVEGGDKIVICASGETRDVVAHIKNLGNNNITAGHVVLKKEGTVIAEQDYAGDLAQFATPATITFSDVQLDLASEYTVELTTINDGPAAKPEVAKGTIDFGLPVQSDNLIEVLVFTDNNPQEISWEIKNDAGDVVASGGPYTAADANQRIITWATIPGNTPQCHSVVLKDSGNNGWDAGNSELGHGMIIVTADEMTTLFYQPVENFGGSATFDAAFRTSGVLANDTFTDSKFSMFPNPTTGIVNFVTDEASINVTVVDMTGKTVYTATDVKNGDSINLTSLQSGVYIANIKGEKSQRVEKIIIK